MKRIREFDAMQGDKEYFLGLGMDGFVSKPIDSDVLYQTIKSFLAEK